MSATTSEVRALPSVSVLLPAWNEASMLDRCLTALLAINWPGLEVILCAGGDDGTAAIAAAFASAHPDRITLLEQRAGEGKQAALRRCFACSHGEMIYLTDADCIVPADTFRQVVLAVADGCAAAATGTADPLPEQVDNPWVRHQWATVRAVDRGRSDQAAGLLGRNCAVRRAAVEAAGGFQDSVRIGTDYHLAKVVLSQGGRIRFVPAPVRTPYAEGIGDYLGQQSRWLRNILVHGPRFRDYAEMRAVARTVALGAGLLVWPLGWRWTRLPGIGIWLAAIAWMTRVRVRQQQALVDETGIRALPPRTVVGRAVIYSFVDLVAWARPLADLVIPGRRLRW
jgi:glycosyltransferase involved in cell wall biosynthesis